MLIYKKTLERVERLNLFNYHYHSEVNGISLNKAVEEVREDFKCEKEVLAEDKLLSSQYTFNPTELTNI